MLKKIAVLTLAASFIITIPGQAAAASISALRPPLATSIPARPLAAPMAAVVESLSQAPALQTIQDNGPAVTNADRRQALDATFDLSPIKPGQTADVQGRESAGPVSLQRGAPTAQSPVQEKTGWIASLKPSKAKPMAGPTLISKVFAFIPGFKTARGAFIASLLSLTAMGCDSGKPLDLDGTWLVDRRSEFHSDTGDEFVIEESGYELIVDQVGPAFNFDHVLGASFGNRIIFGSKRTGSRSEDGNWERGWWRVRSEGWAEQDKAELAVRLEIWDSGGTEILGLNIDYWYSNFVKLDEPERPTVNENEGQDLTF